MSQSHLFPREDAGAIFSPDRRYRYRLFRTWDNSRPKIAFVMLNPSIADEWVLDNTIRRCVQFAKDWVPHFGHIEILNLFALVSTAPGGLEEVEDPVGPENDSYIREYTNGLPVVVAWGNHGRLNNRDKEVLRLLESPYCLGTNKDGSPKHPLYLERTTLPIPYYPPER